MIVVDIWGGKNSMDHVARFYRGVEDAVTIARRELAAGFLVNLRAEASFGPDGDFDSRSRH